MEIQFQNSLAQRDRLWEQRQQQQQEQLFQQQQQQQKQKLKNTLNVPDTVLGGGLDKQDKQVCARNKYMSFDCSISIKI
jgi:hypothetical protein